MPKIRFPVGDIQSLQPAIDIRGIQKQFGGTLKVYALDGKNYYFDSKGPKSGFGTRLVADNSLIENPGGVVQSITAGKATYIFTSKGCYVMAENNKSWIRVLDLATRWPDVPLKDDKKWTMVYLSKGIYFCHPVYGFYKVVKTPTQYYLDPRDQDDIPGLPFQPQAIFETNGRMVVLGFKYVAWSGPSNAEDFLPALGGAGQELLSDRIAGDPVTGVGFQNGFIVWTVQGCLTAEFIGGDSVFRFDRLTTEQLPVNAYAVEALPDGTQVICTKQGIFQIQNATEPTLITPLFSQFVRQRLEHEQGIHVRLTYEIEQDLLFFQMRDWTNHYVHTYVCSMALDKWGSFDERHLGIIKLIPARGNYGYVDNHGRPHKFVETYNREVTPHSFGGLDSNLTIGYIRPPDLLAEIDTLEEMHEINIGGHPAIPSWYPVDLVDLGKLANVIRLVETGHLNIHGQAATFTEFDPVHFIGHSRVSVNGSNQALWDKTEGGQIDIVTGETLVLGIIRESNQATTTAVITANGVALTRIVTSPDDLPQGGFSNASYLEVWAGKPLAGVDIAVVAQNAGFMATGFNFIAWKLAASNSGIVKDARGVITVGAGTTLALNNLTREVGSAVLIMAFNPLTSTTWSESWTGLETVIEDCDLISATGNNYMVGAHFRSRTANAVDDLTLTTSVSTGRRTGFAVIIGP